MRNINITIQSKIVAELESMSCTTHRLKKVIDFEDVLDSLRFLTAEDEYDSYDEAILMAYKSIIAKQLKFASSDRIAPVLYSLLAVLDSMTVRIEASD